MTFVTIVCFFCIFSMFVQSINLDQWIVERKMGKATIHILSIKKSTDNTFVHYTAIFRAPINTEMEESKKGFYWKSISEWEQGPMDSYTDTALYKASLTAPPSTYLIPPVWLTTESERFRMTYAPFATIEMQRDFKFNDCQFQVEKQESEASIKYKITVKTCDCRRRFTASVGKMTPTGFKKTAGLSSLYFFAVNLYPGFMIDDQISSIIINRTALIKDGVEIKSLQFLIEQDQDDFYNDLIYHSQFYYTLI
ncbi:uncharacterized protein LOC133204012 [Saccostrea echinata]|uniref:uncharacterized protein LOC133204012 n=1 Tax=Saccostrea echinata TaxID=191078 RepID=UPI002A83B0FA|nr:uncharacterized protein LOC133204012 [Saccostrea echinata]